MVNQNKLQAIYERFHDVEENDEVINSDGILRLCEELNLDASCDIEVLYLAWKCNAQSCEQWTKQEFMNGMKRLGVDNLSDLPPAFHQIETEELKSLPIFRDFYRFVFLFSREGTKKTIEKEIAIALLSMLKFNDESQIVFKDLCEFLENHTSSNTRVTKDQWTNFLEFAIQVGSDYSSTSYDPNGAWPLLIDEFVEYRNK